MFIYVGLSPSIVVAPSNPGGIYVPPSVNVPSSESTVSSDNIFDSLSKSSEVYLLPEASTYVYGKPVAVSYSTPAVV